MVNTRGDWSRWKKQNTRKRSCQTIDSRSSSLNHHAQGTEAKKGRGLKTTSASMGRAGSMPKAWFWHSNPHGAGCSPGRALVSSSRHVRVSSASDNHLKSNLSDPRLTVQPDSRPNFLSPQSAPSEVNEGPEIIPITEEQSVEIDSVSYQKNEASLAILSSSSTSFPHCTSTSHLLDFLIRGEIQGIYETVREHRKAPRSRAKKWQQPKVSSNSSEHADAADTSNTDLHSSDLLSKEFQNTRGNVSVMKKTYSNHMTIYWELASFWDPVEDGVWDGSWRTFPPAIRSRFEDFYTRRLLNQTEAALLPIRRIRDFIQKCKSEDRMMDAACEDDPVWDKLQDLERGTGGRRATDLFFNSLACREVKIAARSKYSEASWAQELIGISVNDSNIEASD